MARFMRSEKGPDQTGPDQKEELKDQTATSQPAPVQSLDTVRRPGQGSEPSIISAALKVVGNLECEAELRLDGTVEGDVRGKAVTIGETANITGGVYGDTVNAAGTVNGKIEARTVVIDKTARITGDIIHESLHIEAGAFVDGHCRPTYGKTDVKSAPSKPAGTTGQPDIRPADKPASASPAAE